MTDRRGLVAAIDIGGTFTDVVLIDERAGQVWVAKASTTPNDPAAGAAAGLQEIAETSATPASEIDVCVHGTTIVANALVERRGARVALLTTEGCRDVLEIGRESTYDVYNLRAPQPAPLVPADRRFEVCERVGGDGTVVAPVDEQHLQALLAEVGAAAPEAIAIVLLHAYRWSEHERSVLQAVRAALPGVAVTASHDVSPEPREYERTVTTVANAYVQPAVERYLPGLHDQLRATGFTGDLLLTTSSGAVQSVASAAARPVELVESGPAGGAFVAGFYGSLGGAGDVIAFDMGGTTAKAALVEDGQPLICHRLEVARAQRFKAGSGIPLRIPSVDLIEIGAGGGSIARVNELDLLQVGPESAGADPGPACYGRGGDRPTVTDAAVVLGYIGAESMLGGDMALDARAAEAAIERHVAGPLGRDVVGAAVAIHELVTEQMAAAIRTYLAEHGRDQRRYTIVATGGAGPVHIASVARKLRHGRILVGPGSGAASSLGLLVAPPQAERVRGYVSTVEAMDLEQTAVLLEAMAGEITADLADLDVVPGQVTWEASADLRYEGQGSQVTTPLPGLMDGTATAESIAAAFEVSYETLFGRLLPGVGIEASALRLRGTGPSTRPELVAQVLRRRAARAPGDAARGSRAIWSPATGDFAQATVYDRPALSPGDTIRGPAVIEERETTFVLDAHATAQVDEYGNLVATLPATGS